MVAKKPTRGAKPKKAPTKKVSKPAVQDEVLEQFEPSEKNVYELATQLYGYRRGEFKGFGAKCTEARELLIKAHKTGKPVKVPDLGGTRPKHPDREPETIIEHLPPPCPDKPTQPYSTDPKSLYYVLPENIQAVKDANAHGDIANYSAMFVVKNRVPNRAPLDAHYLAIFQERAALMAQRQVMNQEWESEYPTEEDAELLTIQVGILRDDGLPITIPGWLTIEAQAMSQQEYKDGLQKWLSPERFEKALSVLTRMNQRETPAMTINRYVWVESYFDLDRTNPVENINKAHPAAGLVQLQLAGMLGATLWKRLEYLAKLMREDAGKLGLLLLNNAIDRAYGHVCSPPKPPKPPKAVKV